MDISSVIKNLHPLETKVLLRYGLKDELTSAKLQSELGYKEGHANQAFSWLMGKELLAEVARTPHTYYELTDFGRKVQSEGFVEEKIVSLLQKEGAKSMPEIAAALNIEGKDVGSAFGPLSKEGVLQMNAEKKAEATGKPLPQRITVAKALVQKAAAAENATLDAKDLSEEEKQVMAGLTKKRGVSETPFRTIERETVVYKLKEAFEKVAEALKKAGVTGN